MTTTDFLTGTVKGPGELPHEYLFITKDNKRTRIGEFKNEIEYEDLALLTYLIDIASIQVDSQRYRNYRKETVSRFHRASKYL